MKYYLNLILLIFLLGSTAEGLRFSEENDTRKLLKKLQENVKTKGPDYEVLKYSIFRIKAVQEVFDFLEPFKFGGNQIGLGSGFAVEVPDEEEPLIITNAHVVSNSPELEVQLLVYSSEPFPAEVVLICPHFDIAVLKFSQYKKFDAALKEKQMALRPLELATGMPSMGTPVIAMGFPLGQNLLKLAAGEIAGNQEVEGNICIQSTAPISPGNSGGPLLDSEGRKVLGINFAKATGPAENINFVIPAWRVNQMVTRYEYDKRRREQGVKVPDRVQVKIPSAHVQTSLGTEAIYNLDPKCKKEGGVLITGVDKRSFFLEATPKVQVGSYLTSIDGTRIDKFGQGRKAEYLEDQVGFENLFYMRAELFGKVSFQTCSDGKVTTHQVSLVWKPQYEKGIRQIAEPSYENLEYEMFGDISVMQLTVNHIQLLAQQNPGVSRWLVPPVVSSERLVVNYVRGGSEAEEMLKPGMVVKRVNGCKVSSLDHFRMFFIPEQARLTNCGEKMNRNDVPTSSSNTNINNVNNSTTSLLLQESLKSILNKTMSSRGEKKR